MAKDALTVTVPNPHDGDIRQDLLRRILKQADISRREWMNSGKKG